MSTSVRVEISCHSGDSHIVFALTSQLEFFKSIILKTNGGSSLELCQPNYRKLLIKIHDLIFDGEIRSFLDCFHIRLTCL